MELLKKLSQTPGISGREERIRALIKEELEKLADTVSVDAMGNVIALKKGKSGNPAKRAQQEREAQQRAFSPEAGLKRGHHQGSISSGEGACCPRDHRRFNPTLLSFRRECGNSAVSFKTPKLHFS